MPDKKAQGTWLSRRLFLVWCYLLRWFKATIRLPHYKTNSQINMWRPGVTTRQYVNCATSKHKCTKASNRLCTKQKRKWFHMQVNISNVRATSMQECTDITKQHFKLLVIIIVMHKVQFSYVQCMVRVHSWNGCVI